MVIFHRTVKFAGSKSYGIPLYPHDIHIVLIPWNPAKTIWNFSIFVEGLTWQDMDSGLLRAAGWCLNQAEPLGIWRDVGKNTGETMGKGSITGGVFYIHVNVNVFSGGYWVLEGKFGTTSWTIRWSLILLKWLGWSVPLEMLIQRANEG